LAQYESENQKINRELEAWMKLRPEILSCITVALDEKPQPMAHEDSNMENG